MWPIIIAALTGFFIGVAETKGLPMGPVALIASCIGFAVGLAAKNGLR